MHAQFLADIIDHPSDNTPRLIYADWLEENGEPERAEFIRVQCELAKLPVESGHPRTTPLAWSCKCAVCEKAKPLRRRAGELYEQNFMAWTQPFRDLTRMPTADILDDRNNVPASSLGLRWRRGFVAEVRLPLAAWVGERCQECRGNGLEPDRQCSSCHGSGITGRHGPRLVRAAPLERVVLSDDRCCRPEGDMQGRWHGFWVSGNHAGSPYMARPLWKLLAGFDHEETDIPGGPSGPASFRGWNTHLGAKDALGVACLQWARLAAELEGVRAELAKGKLLPRKPWYFKRKREFRRREAELARLVEGRA